MGKQENSASTSTSLGLEAPATTRHDHATKPKGRITKRKENKKKTKKKNRTKGDPAKRLPLKNHSSSPSLTTTKMFEVPPPPNQASFTPHLSEPGNTHSLNLGHSSNQHHHSHTTTTTYKLSKQTNPGSAVTATTRHQMSNERVLQLRRDAVHPHGGGSATRPDQGSSLSPICRS